MGQLSLTMNSDKAVTAHFQAYHLLKTNVLGGGAITGSTSTSQLNEGASVTLNAQADPGWAFKEWRGDLGGANPRENLVMDGDKFVTAVFEQSYENWATVTLTGLPVEDRLPEANPDNDNLNNFQEYLAASDPRVAFDTRSKVETFSTEDSIVLRFWRKKGASGGVVNCQFSTDLHTWKNFTGKTRILQSRKDCEWIEVEVPFAGLEVFFMRVEYR